MSYARDLDIMMTKNFVLFTGYLDRGRSGSYSAKSRLENSLDKIVKNENIDGTFIVFWNDDKLKDNVNYPDNDKKIFKISIPQVSHSSTGNWLSQMESFRAGISKIYNVCNNENIDHENVKVFKTRPDGIVSDECFKKVFSLDDRIFNDNKVLKFKIWNPWFFLNKPFYLSDCFFAARLCDISSLYNVEEYSRENIGQGITHIRRFAHPFLDKFPIFEEYMSGKYDLTSGMNKIFTYELNKLPQGKREYMISLLSLYYYIIDGYFNIWSEPDYIKHNGWLDKQLTRGCEILNFSQLNNQKFGFWSRRPPGDIYMYSNKWITNLLNGRFLDDELSHKILLNIYNLEKEHGTLRAIF